MQPRGGFLLTSRPPIPLYFTARCASPPSLGARLGLPRARPPVPPRRRRRARHAPGPAAGRLRYRHRRPARAGGRALPQGHPHRHPPRHGDRALPGAARSRSPRSAPRAATATAAGPTPWPSRPRSWTTWRAGTSRSTPWPGTSNPAGSSTPTTGPVDIRRRLIRAIGDPVERFREDGLRPLRACRFAAQLGFTVDEPTLAAIPRALDVLRRVSAERVRDELAEDPAGPGPLRRPRAHARDRDPAGRSCPSSARATAWRRGSFTAGTCSPTPARVRRGAARGPRAAPRRAPARRRQAPRAGGRPSGRPTFHGHEKLSARDGLGDPGAPALPQRSDPQAWPTWSASTCSTTRRNGPTRPCGGSSPGSARTRSTTSSHCAGPTRSACAPRTPPPSRRASRGSLPVCSAVREGARAFTVRELAVDGTDVMAGLGIGPGPRWASSSPRCCRPCSTTLRMNEKEKLLDIAGRLYRERMGGD